MEESHLTHIIGIILAVLTACQSSWSFFTEIRWMETARMALRPCIWRFKRFYRYLVRKTTLKIQNRSMRHIRGLRGILERGLI
jgi:hypothetical protein